VDTVGIDKAKWCCHGQAILKDATMAHKLQLEHSDDLMAGPADAAGVHLFIWQWQQGHFHAVTQRCHT